MCLLFLLPTIGLYEPPSRGADSLDISKGVSFHTVKNVFTLSTQSFLSVLSCTRYEPRHWKHGPSTNNQEAKSKFDQHF